ncbi:MAG: hypothetical protein NC400_09040 [Clostridium sp.]|nr:hypothetical protein [Clostridium sp.]
MNSLTGKERIVHSLILCYLIPAGLLLAANAFFSLFQTTYMELYQDVEKPLYKPDFPVLLLFLTLLFIGLTSFLLGKCAPAQGLCKLLEKASLVYCVIICLLIIFIYRVNVACDSASLSEIAVAFLKGDYSSLSDDGYLVHYPHQLGMISLLELVYFIFGVNNFTVLQFLNTAAIFSTVYFLHRIAEELFHNDSIQILLSVLCFGMLPLYLYSTFIYGDIPGMGLAVPAIYLVIRYLNTKKRSLIVPGALCMGFAILLKSNNSVILAAAVIILALHFISTKDWFSLVFAGALLLAPSLGTFAINLYYAKASGLPIPDGIPKIAWIAMGLQENDYLENGWYNGYNWTTYTATGFDADKTAQLCMASLKESLSSFLSSPKSGLRFFYRKFISQWNDPGFQCQITNEWYSRHRDDQSPLALYLIYGNGRLILEWLMNLYHFLILFGASICAFFHIKKRSLPASFLILCVFGGYFFHLFWEAGGRYGLGYFVLCVPMAAYGLWRAADWLPGFVKKLRAA